MDHGDSEPEDWVRCRCGVLLQLDEEPHNTCKVCQAVDASVRRQARHSPSRRRPTPSPEQRLAASYARLRAQRTGKKEDPVDFLEQARRDLENVHTRVASRSC